MDELVTAALELAFAALVIIGLLAVASGIDSLDWPRVGAGTFLVVAGELADWRRRRG